MSKLFASIFPQNRNVCKIDFWLIYAISVIFNFHILIVIYSNSSFMEQFTSPETIGALYTISSCLAVLAFLFISRVLRKIGNVRLTLWLATVELISLIVLGLVSHPATVILAFVIFNTLNPLIYLSIDIFSETLIGEDEGSTGSKRGLTLTLMSLAAAAGPFTLALIVGDNNDDLYKSYLASAGILTIFILTVLSRFYCFADPVYKEIKVLPAIRSFWVVRDVRSVFLAHLNLQVFFTWGAIYIPLYMATQLGFSWAEIGTIIGIGLLAYVIFEWPVGWLADNYIGEKEMMAMGFVVIALTVSWISFLDNSSVLTWTILMFASRFGASLVEATTESYFFKHTKGTDANIMSFFRLTRPLGTIIGTLVGGLALLYLPFNLIFIVFGFLMLPGVFFTMQLRDTK